MSRKVSAGYGNAVNNSVVPELTGLDEAAKDEGRRRPDVRGPLGSLFPESPESAPPVPVRRLLSAVLHLVAVALGAVLLLERIPGRPSWDTIYNEDKWEFLRQALQQPWHVFIQYGGYYQLLPRVIAQFAQYLPLAQASRLFAVCGALIASGCGLFIFHASAGHVRAMPLRATIETIYVIFASIMLGAVRDGYLRKTPCVDIRLPRSPRPSSACWLPARCSRSLARCHSDTRCSCSWARRPGSAKVRRSGSLSTALTSPLR
jgi:hypothetical protein